MLNQVKSAFITLTRLPFLKIADEDFDLKNSLWAFPLVGFALACILSLGIFVLEMFNFPAFVSALLVIILLTLLTGALHEDGLADCIDALGASSIERRLEIMRDSQIGTYGTLALIFSVGIRCFALAAFWENEMIISTLFISLMVSRGAMVFLPFFAAPARDNGLAAMFINIELKQMVISQIIIAVMGVLIIGTDIMFMMIIGLLIAMMVGRFATQKIGGFTGDVLGATEQLVQISCFLIFLALL